MLAVVIQQFGNPSQLKVKEVPTPEPGNNEVLVEIKAASINPSDIKNVAGTMHGTTLPRIPGRDFAGVVTKGPPNLIGKEVWGTGGDIGFTRDGSHAQFILLPATAITPKPPSLSMEAAGSAGLTFVTAWSAMVTAAEISSGETAVIIGAAGGVGSAAVQIAKSRGARVIAIVRSDNDFPDARQNGAAEVINSSSVKIVEAVQSITNKRGANVVFDTSGMMFPEAVEIACADGRIPIISAPPDGKTTINLRTIYRKTQRIIGVDTRSMDATACARILAQMTPDFAAGRLTAKPSQSFPLTDAIAAYEQAARGSRVVLLPST
ncbi:MAG TPA: zinc-binding alcohol dehydrogenase family protein [Tepidisphaeraceae bacterium]|jgi:NADPH:quinone reductase-like Zn-dependent oxidoreductase